MKIRLDKALIDRGLAADSREAQALIGAGKVFVNDTNTVKAGQLIDEKAAIRCKKTSKYVSRGGLKLEHGLSAFAISPAGWTCIDVGASSGGFTDCLLQHGAERVFAVDVNYGQLDWKIRSNPRVVVMERFNARQITRDDLTESVQLAVIDASFISLTQFISPLMALFELGQVRILALIKPQFELSRHKVAQGGVVTDPTLHAEAVKQVVDYLHAQNLIVEEVIESPVLGAKGNREFLLFAHS